eukprot:TRINITY_DN1909_c0_g1_i1.p1 TRINITY_DN1909_c0_g1~~TRINITY_DN1909_c0_g1_i1.p1  ORF type:complete len:314 (-),score=83.15 TRINITY_DN1909_c0_g1_i1:1-942(-)
MVQALMFACVKGSLPIVQRLHKAGANLHISNVAGMNALMLAATNGHSNCITFLLHEGADVRSRNLNGQTALGLSKDQKCCSILEAALKQSDKKNQTDVLQLIQQEENQKKKLKKKKKKPASSSPKPAPEIAEPSLNQNPPTRSNEPIPSQAVTTIEDDGEWQVYGQKKSHSKAKTDKSNASSSSDQPSNPTRSSHPKPAWGPGSLHYKDASPSTMSPTSHTRSSSIDSDIQEVFAQQHPRVSELDLHWKHLIGMNLEELSMSQLEALEEMHFLALQTLNRHKMELIRHQERLSLEEKNALIHQMQQFQINLRR